MKKTIVRYTLLFLLVLVLICLPLIVRGKVFVYSGDGVSQHIPFMRYYAQWLRDSISALTHGRPVPQYAYSMGYGSDILAALNWYGMGDPLCLLYALFTAEHVLIGFCVISILRAYLAGLAMIALIHRFGAVSRRFIPIAGICYAFGAFAFSLALLRHPFFFNPLVQLPLLILGVDKLFRNESPLPFVLAVAWTALCGYYFLYMCCVFLFIFAVVRFVSLNGRDTLRRLPAAFGKCVLYFLIGMCIAAPVFVPAFTGFLGCGRSGAVFGPSTADRLSLEYLFQLPYKKLSKLAQGTCLPPLLWLAFFVGLPRKDRFRPARIALSVCAAVMMILPVTDYIMNGFSYSTTRWTFGLSTFLVFWGMNGMSSMLKLSRWQRRAVYGLGLLAVAYFAYIALSILLKNRTRISFDTLESVSYPAMTAAGFFAAIFAIWWIYRPAFQGRHQAKTAATRLLSIVLAANVILVGYLWVIPRVFTHTYRTPRALSALYQSSPLVSLNWDDADEFVRVDSDVSAMTHINDCTTSGISSTVFYNSTLPSSLCDGVSEMNLPILMCNRLCGLNGRSCLEAVWSISDYVRVKDDANQCPVPYGFSLKQESDVYERYHNDNALPFGYTTSAYVTDGEYRAASAEEKQWMLLQAATLQEEDDRYEHIAPQYSYATPDFSLECSDSVQYSEGRLVVAKNGWIKLTFNGVENSETYLKLQGLVFEKYAGNTVTWLVSNGEAAYEVDFSTPDFNQLYPDQRDYLVNTGYSQAPRNEITISFNDSFEARIDRLSIVCQPMDGFADQLRELQSEAMRDVAFDVNTITGNCNVSRDSILVMALPYIKGWSAVVDGQSTEVFKSGNGLSAIRIPEGQHVVRLTYRSPGTTAGFIAFLAGALALVLCLVLRRRRPQGIDIASGRTARSDR